MSKLRLATSAMLVAALPALTTGAGAAPGFPHAIAAGVAHTDYRLVQYGGGGGGCDDDCPRPQPRHNGGGNGNGNGAAAAGAIINLLGNIARQHQLEQQQKNNEMQRRAIDEQNRRNRAIDDRNRRNRAIQDDRIRRAKQEELDRLRRDQQAERDKLKKLEQQRQDEAERRNEEKAADDKRKKQEEAVREEEHEQKQRDQAYNSEPYEPGEQIEDKLENNLTVRIVVVPHDDRPDIDNVQPLYVNKNTQLPACGYVTLPADREICSGRTASGGWLRIVNVPTVGGSTRAVCMSFCPPASRPKIPEKRPKVVERHDSPYVPPVTPPSYQPPVVKPVTPAVQTAKADSYVEPPHRQPLTPAVTTVKSDPYTEPTPIRKPTPAVTTVKSDPYTEPTPVRKLTPAVITVRSDPYTEPGRKFTPAVQTAIADPYIEPRSDRPPVTPAALTVAAHPFTQPDAKRPRPESRPPRLDQGQLDEATPALPDSKCTAAGVKPLDQAISEPLAKFNSPAFKPREVVTTAIAGIPNGVGNVLSAITKAFWKDDSSEKLFDAMKKYVDEVVPAAIAKYDDKQLKNDLKAINDYLRAYNEDWGAGAKAIDLHDLKKQLVGMKPRFLNPESPGARLAEFVAFASLHLAALKEEYDHYDQYHPVNEHEPNGIVNQQHNRALVRSELNGAIKEYQDHIEALRKDLIADRLNKLRVNDRGSQHFEFFSVDAPDVPVIDDYYSVKDDFCDWQGPEHNGNPFAAWADMAGRQTAVAAAYNKLIDELTAPISQWKPI